MIRLKCASCGTEGFDALINVHGPGPAEIQWTTDYCLDCVNKWSYANKRIVVSKPKIEYHCAVCKKQLFPQNGVTYVYRDIFDVTTFYCRDDGEVRYDTPKVHVQRYTRQMHLDALAKLDKNQKVEVL